MQSMFQWKMGDDNVYKISAPIQTLRISSHVARIRMHVCAECFAPIHVGERYSQTIYKDCESGSISAFKTHLVCPYDVEIAP